MWAWCFHYLGSYFKNFCLFTVATRSLFYKKRFIRNEKSTSQNFSKFQRTTIQFLKNTSHFLYDLRNAPKKPKKRNYVAKICTP